LIAESKVEKGKVLTKRGEEGGELLFSMSSKKRHILRPTRRGKRAASALLAEGS